MCQQHILTWNFDLMKKLLLIGGLFFIFIIVFAFQKNNKIIVETESSCCHLVIDEFKEKTSANNDVKPDTDTTCIELPKERYKEIAFPTPNIDKKVKNDVKGVILHHTAEPTVKRSLEVLTSPTKKVGTHCVIDTDGTRYIMCKPEVVTYHAGLSILNGREGCNYFTIGIEFQGNTLENPLTVDQINSAIEYLNPIIAEHDIPISNIVTHEMVRKAYKQKHPYKRCSGKVDITQAEYVRFMDALKKVIHFCPQCQ